MLVDIFFLTLGLLFAFIFLYLFVLALAGFWPEKRREEPAAPQRKFALVIPAHNESALLEETLVQLRRVDYPPDLYEVFVIADNCTDDTALIARRQGVTCWERSDPEHRGKGYVLQWAFARLPGCGDHGAYLVIDADTRLAPDFLRVLNDRLLAGAQAMQGYSDIARPERSPMESLSYLGFVLNRNLRYRGRTRLGWTSNLMGTGMCFAREVIERFGWPAVSIVEDVEYEMFLHLRGVRVAFVPEARLWVQMHDTFRQTEGQRRRWDLGKFAVRNHYLPQLLREGVRRRDLSYMDSALELLIPPYSLFIVLLLFCFLLYLGLGYSGADFTFWLWVGVMTAAAGYTLAGLASAGAGWRVYRALFYGPFFLLWRLWVVCRGAGRKNRQQW